MSDKKYRAKVTTNLKGTPFEGGEAIRAGFLTEDEIKGFSSAGLIEEIDAEDGEAGGLRVDAAPSETPVHSTKAVLPAEGAKNKKVAE